MAAEIDGVRYYEDSLATNPAAAAAAIRAFDRPLVLIAGGQRHSAGPEDFGPMALALGEKVVRAVLLIGAMAPHILGVNKKILQTDWKDILLFDLGTKTKIRGQRN